MNRFLGTRRCLTVLVGSQRQRVLATPFLQRGTEMSARCLSFCLHQTVAALEKQQGTHSSIRSTSTSTNTAVVVNQHKSNGVDSNDIDDKKDVSTTKTSSSSSSTGTIMEDTRAASAAACGHDLDDHDDDDDDEMEQEDMFVQPHESFIFRTLEWGGPRRGGRYPEPTRYGDWERKGRCTDF